MPSVHLKHQPLKGRLILDCSTHLPGPMVGKLLAQRGAKVLKVENPDRPDPAREMGAFYQDLNQLKTYTPINLLTPQGQQQFQELVKQADALIEGFRPQAKLKLKLDEPSLHAINPRLNILSIIGYPEDGPWRDRPGHDNNFQATTGCLSLFNEMPALPLGDIVASYESAFALTAAMDATARDPKAKGTRTVISMTESLKNMQSMLVADFKQTKLPPHHGTTLFSGKFPCYRLYTHKDGRRISMGAIEHKFWEQVCDILGTPELKTKGYTTEHEGAQTANRIQQALDSKPWSHWAPKFDEANCCVEPVLTYEEVYGV